MGCDCYIHSRSKRNSDLVFDYGYLYVLKFDGYFHMNIIKVLDSYRIGSRRELLNKILF